MLVNAEKTKLEKNIDVRELSQIEIENLWIEKEINQSWKFRKNMLFIHEILGWTTVGLLSLNTFFLTPELVDQDIHTLLGIAGGSTYIISAGIAVFTPTLHEDMFILGKKEKSNKFIHKVLAFIHFPAMLTTVVLGLLIEERNEGESDISYEDYKTMRTIHSLSSILTVSTLSLSLAMVYVDY